MPVSQSAIPDENEFIVKMVDAVHFASGALYSGFYQGRPLAVLGNDPKKLSHRIEAILSVHGTIKPVLLAEPLNCMAIPDCPPLLTWSVRSPVGELLVIAVVEDEAFPFVGPDAEAILSHIAVIRRMRRMTALQIAHSNAHDAAAPKRAAAEARLAKAKTCRSMEILSRPPMAAKLDKMLGRYRVTAWRPDCLPCQPSEAVSGYFLSPWMQHREAWPEVDGCPMTSLLQLDLSELPAEAQDLIGGKGLLQFFYCPPAWDFDDDQRSVLLRRVFPDTSSGSARAQPDAAWDDIGRPTFATAITGWTAVKDTTIDFSISAKNRVDTFEERFDLDVETVEPTSSIAGDKLMGSPDWIEQTTWPTSGRRKMKLLFQIDTLCSGSRRGFMFGPGSPISTAFPGTGYILVDPGCPDKMMFRWEK